MITVTTTTQMHFINEKEFENFMATDDQVKILGFDEEIRQSKIQKMPIVVQTYRPRYGCVTISTVSYSEVIG